MCFGLKSTRIKKYLQVLFWKSATYKYNYTLKTEVSAHGLVLLVQLSWRVAPPWITLHCNRVKTRKILSINMIILYFNIYFKFLMSVLGNFIALGLNLNSALHCTAMHWTALHCSVYCQISHCSNLNVYEKYKMFNVINQLRNTYQCRFHYFCLTTSNGSVFELPITILTFFLLVLPFLASL